MLARIEHGGVKLAVQRASAHTLHMDQLVLTAARVAKKQRKADQDPQDEQKQPPVVHARMPPRHNILYILPSMRPYCKR